MAVPVFDFVVVGGGSAGAVVAARLSEDPTVRVCLLETGGAPPPEELVPAACASLLMSPLTDWAFDAEAPNMSLGTLTPGRSYQPRGKMLGGSSGINYMAYVRGHPGDFDSWAKGGAQGWSYRDVLPYFRKSEGWASPEHVREGGIVLEPEAHSKSGPLGVSVRSPVLPFAEEFLRAAQADGLPLIDYNGGTRGGPAGGCSLFHTTTKDGKRTSTFHAFLEPNLGRPNLKIVSGALATKVAMEGLRAVGVEYRLVSGETATVMASREVVLSAGAFGSPALLLHSGIGPKQELEAVGVPCTLDNPHVGKHMKDHLMLTMFYTPSPGSGVKMGELGLSLGPDALRGAGFLPADPKKDAGLPQELRAVKAEAERRVAEWAAEGTGLASSTLYDAVAFYSTGLGDEHTHDAQIACLGCGYNADIWRVLVRMDAEKYFGSEEKAREILSDEGESIVLLATPAQPHSEGEVKLVSSDPTVRPALHMNYLSDPHDVKVFQALVRRTMDIAAKWTGLGPLFIPEVLRKKHNYKDGGALTDAFIEDWVRHFGSSNFHPTSTCRIGDVVDPQLRVKGVSGLRVVDASVMPNVISGNTNAPSVMIGEKGAELIAQDHGVLLQELVAPLPAPLARAGA